MKIAKLFKKRNSILSVFTKAGDDLKNLNVQIEKEIKSREVATTMVPNGALPLLDIVR